jgi:hypothetical protein
MRKPSRVALIAAFLLIFVAGSPDQTTANEWSPVIIARGSYRSQLRSMPIEKRPYRPLHVYGNAVRLNRERSRAQQPLGSVITVARPLRLLGISR